MKESEWFATGGKRAQGETGARRGRWAPSNKGQGNQGLVGQGLGASGPQALSLWLSRPPVGNERNGPHPPQGLQGLTVPDAVTGSA